MIVVKELNKEQAIQEFNKLLGNTKDKLTVSVYDAEEALYSPVKKEKAISFLEEKIVFVYSDYYKTEVKFRPTKDGNVKMVVY